jgi:hypothetical protein
MIDLDSTNPVVVDGNNAVYQHVIDSDHTSKEKVIPRRDNNHMVPFCIQ